MLTQVFRTSLGPQWILPISRSSKTRDPRQIIPISRFRKTRDPQWVPPISMSQNTQNHFIGIPAIQVAKKSGPLDVQPPCWPKRRGWLAILNGYPAAQIAPRVTYANRISPLSWKAHFIIHKLYTFLITPKILWFKITRKIPLVQASSTFIL